MKRALLFLLFLVVGWRSESTRVGSDRPEAMSLLGRPLYAPEPGPEALEQIERAREAYRSNPTNADNLIWYGRRTAYSVRYNEAIRIFTEGIAAFPGDARFLRHRGHRYISTRKLDLARQDLERAAELIEGTTDAVEPDGIPNRLNRPLTTLHSNVWYHLGLVYYLEHDWERALRSFTACRDLGLNDDNLVSSTHWIVMILRRMGRHADAVAALEPVTHDLQIVENDAYWRLCLFYKGLLSEEEALVVSGAAPSSDAVLYGLANWLYTSGDSVAAIDRLEEIVSGPSWSSFGFIAAESDLAHLSGRMMSR